MAKFCVLFLVYFTSVIVSGSASVNRTCDYKFGDSSWDNAKTFYDKDVKFPAGASKHAVTLPTEKGLMISYVCVNLPVGIDKKTTKVDYHPLDAELAITLAKATTKDFTYHVLALRHGY